MKTAIAVMAWNRVDHLANILTSLDMCNHGHDVWVFVDGPRPGCKPELRKQIRDNIELATQDQSINVMTSYTNSGASKSLLAQMDYLFCEKGYGRVIQFCDDLIVSPHYISNVDYMLDIFESDQRVGAVSAFGGRLNPDHDPHTGSYTSMSAMIGMGMWHDRWIQYVQEVAKLCELGKESWPEKKKMFSDTFGGPFKDDMSYSCDGLLYLSMLRRNQIPISTVANCLKHVGVEGEFTTPETYNMLQWGEMPFFKDPVRIKHPGDSFFDHAIPTLKKQYRIL